MNPLSSFFETVTSWGYPISTEQKDRFQQYLALLLEWNERMNLTAVRAPQEIGRRHFLDAMQLLPFLPVHPVHMIDVGSGAGFPGVPLKIMRPDLTLVLVESVRKKGRFLSALVSRLALERTQVLVARAEAIGQDPRHRERYDVVTARAVAQMRVLAEYLLPLCAVHGRVLAPKGESAVAESAAAAEAIHLLGGDAPRLHPLTAGNRETPGYVVEIEKIAPTPFKFPRRIGVPAKRPL